MVSVLNFVFQFFFVVRGRAAACRVSCVHVAVPQMRTEFARHVPLHGLPQWVRMYNTCVYVFVYMYRYLPMYYPILMPHYSYQIVARGGLQMRPIWGWARVGDRRARNADDLRHGTRLMSPKHAEGRARPGEKGVRRL